MKYCLCLDGGGSKLNARVFDEEFRLVATGRGGGVNTTQNAPEVARQSIFDCLKTIPDEIRKLESVRAVFVGDRQMLLPILHARFEFETFIEIGEAQAGLLAGAGKTHGLLAIAGTGADLMHVKPNGEVAVVGAWGPLLGDQGSGAWIGLQAVRAAVRELNGWGEETLITQLLLDKFGIQDRPYELVHIIHGSRSHYSFVASFTPLVGKAAESGDEVALRILRAAGSAMAIQMESLLRRSPAPDETEITLCGGAWKSHPVMLETFREKLRLSHPELTVKKPWFEHVLAGAMQLALERGMTPEQARVLFRERFPMDCIEQKGTGQ